MWQVYRHPKSENKIKQLNYITFSVLTLLYTVCKPSTTPGKKYQKYQNGFDYAE